MGSSEVIRFEQSGHRFEAGGVGSFVVDEGTGDPVVCLHGVPASAYLYRKLVPELATRGLRGVAFDLPGLGLADRPSDFDYSWTGLGRFASTAIEALGIDRFHLVVHDIGGPVGFEVAAADPDRVKSMTILNTISDPATFHRPWVMHPFSMRGIGRAYLTSLIPPLFRVLMHWQGIGDRNAVSNPELDAYVELLKRDDGGAAFLKIMRGFELTPAKRDLYHGVLGSGRFPIQIIWGEHDPALTLAKHGLPLAKVAGVPEVIRVPGKHFIPEDQAPAIAQHVADFVV
jgi:pimeloyl-ACP methyl ester carboxylesterase